MILGDLWADEKFREGLSMAKTSLAGVTIAGVCAFLGLGIVGYILIKILIPKAQITSWWRNKDLSGTGFDWHMVGLAYDIAPASKENFDAAVKIFPSVIVEKGNIITSLDKADHIHVAWINKKLGVLQG